MARQQQKMGQICVGTVFAKQCAGGRFEHFREIVLHGVIGQEHVPWVGFEMLTFEENLDGRIHVKIKGPGRVPMDAFSSVGLGVAAVGSVEIGEGITAIGEGAFAGCANLRSLKVANTVKTIADGALDRCGLRSVKLPDDLERIPGFGGCDALKSIPTI